MSEPIRSRPIVGIVIPTVDNSFFSSLSAAASRFLFSAGCTPLILSSANDAETEKEHLRSLAALYGVSDLLAETEAGAAG